MFCKINGERKCQELHLSTCIQLRMTKHPSRKAMNFRHLLGCDTIVRFKMLALLPVEKTAILITISKLIPLFKLTKMKQFTVECLS